MKTKNFVRIVTLIITSYILNSTSIAQQLPYFSQYVTNDFVINPAIAGSKTYNPVLLTFRSQWLGFNDAPMTQTASMHGSFGEKIGVGGFIFNDVTGPISNSGLQLAYAYHLATSEFSKLSFGLAGMLFQNVLDKSAITTDQQGDLAIQGQKEKRMTADAVFGMNFQTQNFYIGLSVPQIFQAKLNYSDNEAQPQMSKLVRHYFLLAGYKFQLNADYYIEPSALLKATGVAPMQFDVNAKLLYKDLLWGGFSYRLKESVIAMIGLRKESFQVSYSYDLTLSNIKKYSTGSHEISLGLNFPKIKKKSKASY